MNDYFDVPIPLLKFLGACIYGDAKTYYSGLSEAEHIELEKQGNIFGMAAWFYRYLYDILPEKKREEYRSVYQSHKVKALLGEQELKRLYREMAVHNLRFVPIKGADLAYRLYPDAALRNFVDWDILFHPDDSKRALAVLAEDGWTIPKNCSNDHETVQKSGAHHFSPHVRRQYCIEPHFALANFDDIDLHEIWNYTVEYPTGDGQIVLSPEMNILMLTRHASSESYYHAQIPKLLTDVAFVMQKENVDFTVLHELADRFHFPYPGDLLAAFPEFFPAEVIEAFRANPEKTEVFRRIFELRGQLGEQDSISLALSRYKERGRVMGGVVKHIQILSPNRIRLTYHLPRHGAWERVVWSYVCWFCTRSMASIRWVIKRNQTLRTYSHMIESVESASSLKRIH